MFGRMLEAKELIEKMESMDGDNWEFNFKGGELRWRHYNSDFDSSSALESKKNGKDIKSLLSYLGLKPQQSRHK